MRIVDCLRSEAVIADLAGDTARGVLGELCRPLAPVVDSGRLLEALLAREKLGSTGIGDGVAIPHARLPGLPKVVACFGRSRAGIDFGAADGKPAHFFFTVLSPEGSVGVQSVGAQVGGVHVRLLARISLLFMRPSFRDAVMRARDAAEIYGVIAIEDVALSR
jgi:nitrogen PTS system EIIA component